MAFAGYCKNLITSPDVLVSFDNILGSGWLNLTALTLMSMIFLYVLIYLIAEFLRDSKLIAWSKFELFQIFVTAIIAILLIGMINWMCSFDVSGLYKIIEKNKVEKRLNEIKSNCDVDKIPNAPITPYCVANEYIQTYKTYGKTIYWLVLVPSVSFISYLVKISYAAHPMGIGFNNEPGAGFNQFLNLITVAMTGYMLTFISLYTQERLLEFFIISIPYYFLPIGILLRAFAPTREFGGAILGFSIASLFFYPLTYVLADLALSSNYDIQEIEKANEEIKKGIEQNQNPYQDLVPSGDDLGQHEEIKNKITTQVEKTNINSNNINPNKSIWEKIGSEISDIFDIVNIFIAKYFIAVGVIPIINFIIYIQATIGLSQMLGSRMDITNLTRMI
jgi:hypothetical protein